MNNPRPLKTPSDFSKLLYRVEVSKDLIKGMVLKSYDTSREKAIKQKLEDGMTPYQIIENGPDLDDNGVMEGELRKQEM